MTAYCVVDKIASDGGQASSGFLDFNFTPEKRRDSWHSDAESFPTGLTFSQMQNTRSDLIQLVQNSLEYKDRVWSTVSAVARDTGLKSDEVQAAIRVLVNKGVIARAERRSSGGESLFTTRRHLSEKSSFLEKLAAVLKNRAS